MGTGEEGPSADDLKAIEVDELIAGHTGGYPTPGQSEGLTLSRQMCLEINLKVHELGLKNMATPGEPMQLRNKTNKDS